MDLRNHPYNKPPQPKKPSAGRKVWRFFRGALVILSTITLTTVVINATDNLGNMSNSVLGLVIGGEDAGMCPEGMVYIKTAETGFCIDIYEASAGEDCPVRDPRNQEQTRKNLESASCKAASTLGATPWRNIARHQAELACAQAGKRLPTNIEWYRASLGTPDAKANVQREDCNINSSQVMLSGQKTLCASTHGTYDMIGNVWEWVEETVSNGVYRNRELPGEGYVIGIDSAGVPIDTSSTTPDLNFNEDYFSVEHEGTRGIIRGGYFRSGSDAGQYALNAITPPSFTGDAVGFRCAL